MKACFVCSEPGERFVCVKCREGARNDLAHIKERGLLSFAKQTVRVVATEAKAWLERE